MQLSHVFTSPSGQYVQQRCGEENWLSAWRRHLHLLQFQGTPGNTLILQFFHTSGEGTGKTGRRGRRKVAVGSCSTGRLWIFFSGCLVRGIFSVFSLSLFFILSFTSLDTNRLFLTVRLLNTTQFLLILLRSMTTSPLSGLALMTSVLLCTAFER